MKGFDLFIWKKEKEIYYTLLPGTNREKTNDEIYDLKLAVDGQSIKEKISKIATGEYLFFKPIQIDTAEISWLKEYTRQKGIITYP